jgi:ribosomal protein L40E
MNKAAGITVTVCPHCDAKIVGQAEQCSSCGKPLEPQVSEQRLTMPGEAHVSEQAARSDSAPPSSNLQEITDEHDSWFPQGPDPLIGFVVAGRYRILECIGRGGMGVVY